MARYSIEDTTLTNIADAIRAKTGSNSDILVQDMANEISGIEVGGEMQSKTVTPTTSKQTVVPDNGYDGLSSVVVNAMPTATQATPSVSISSSGLITASATQTAGYVAAGTKSGTKQLSTQAAKTITPSTSSQTAVASGVYTTGAVTVAAIPSSYVKPTSTKAATTYTPTTSNQTIATGTYCSGVQTIKGDANLKAENIAEGVSIFGVTGTHSGGGSGGGGSVETCTATISTAQNTCVFGYGSCECIIPSMDVSLGIQSMPSTVVNVHNTAVPADRIFNDIPIGSVFIIYKTTGSITGVSTEGDVEFGYANHQTTQTATYQFLVCRFNGTGTITVT